MFTILRGFMKQLWVKKHAPKTVSDVVYADDDMKRDFLSYSKNKEFPHLMLSGHPGTGKSSTSNALVNDCQIDPMDVLRINCSKDKIEAMRDKVASFAQTMPIGRFKVVQLEEFDRLSHDAQGLLNAVIEDYSDTCRFIATCNYPNKILPALHSRFTKYSFGKPDRDQLLLKAAEVLEAEKVEFDVDTLDNIVTAGYPDLRKIIGMLEVGSRDGVLKSGFDSGIKDWKLDLLPFLVKGDISGARKLVCSSASQDELVDVFRFLYENSAKFKKQDEAIVVIAEYMYKHAFAADPELNIAAMFIALQMAENGN